MFSESAQKQQKVQLCAGPLSKNLVFIFQSEFEEKKKHETSPFSPPPHTWLIRLSVVSWSTVLAPVSDIVGLAVAHLLCRLSAAEQAVTGHSEANGTLFVIDLVRYRF